MIISRPRVQSLLPLLAAGSLCSPLMGATLVETETFSFLPNDVVTLTFNRFDTLGGTRVLESVLIEIEYTKSGGFYAVDNESPSMATVSLTHRVDATVDGGSLDLSLVSSGYLGLPATNLRATSTVSGVQLAANDGDPSQSVDEAGLDYYRYNPDPMTRSTSGYIADVSQFELSEGDSTFDLAFEATQTVSISGLSGASQSFAPSSVDGYIRVTYQYSNVVPEPHLFGQIGLAGMLALLIRRRRH